MLPIESYKMQWNHFKLVDSKDREKQLVILEMQTASKYFAKIFCKIQLKKTYSYIVYNI